MTAPPPNKQQKKAPEPLICPMCHSQWPDGEFCRRCGTAFKAPEPDKPNTKLNLARALFVAVPVAIWFFFFHDSKPKPVDPGPEIVNPSQSGIMKKAVELAKHAKASSQQELLDHSAPAIVTLMAAGEGGKMHAVGAGFLIDQTLLATTAHNIQGVAAMKAHFSSNEDIRVTNVLATDLEHDVALLRLDDTDAPYLPRGDAKALTRDEKVLAIGTPEGLYGAAAQGIIKGNDGNVLVTNLPVHADWSGGPLLTMEGEVVGLMTSQPPPGYSGTVNSNTHFAIPIEAIDHLLANPNPKPAQELGGGIPDAMALTIGSSVRAHDHASFNFTTPKELDPAYLLGSFTGSDNNGADMTVKILRGSEVVYDSANAVDTNLKVKLKPGAYTMTVANTAGRVEVFKFSGHFFAKP